MRKLKIRDVIFGGIGTGILYHEVVVVATAEPLLIFAAFFLLGLIPASRADEGNSTYNPKDWLREWLKEDKEPPKGDKR